MGRKRLIPLSRTAPLWFIFPMFLVIDNYDSFVYNLTRYIELAGGDCEVVRNNAISVEGALALRPDGIILSPGPCAPAQAGICVDLVRAAGPHIPILGVCLGHQCIGEAYGGKTIRTNAPVHGKASMVTHNGTGIFSGLPNPMPAGRYHSLATKLPPVSPLTVTAFADDIPMAMQHKTHPVYSVLFHPESVLTPHGQALIENYVAIALGFENSQRQAA